MELELIEIVGVSFLIVFEDSGRLLDLYSIGGVWENKGSLGLVLW